MTDVGNINIVIPKISGSGKTIVQALLLTVIASAGLQLDFVIAGDLDADYSDGSGVAPGDGGDGKRAREPGRMSVEFTGTDTPMLIARNGELLNAMEHIAAKALHLEPEEHDRISFDADSYKANRDFSLRRSAAEAVESVRRSGRPYAFAPMTSHERRQLHLLLQESGLPTASSGEVPRRYVVLYPEGYEAGQSLAGAGDGSRPIPTEDRAHAVRSSFRRR
jgi:spoIIIJ-associated protein